jgi:hypothetical protein
VALSCASAGAAHNTNATAETGARQRFIGASKKFDETKPRVWRDRRDIGSMLGQEVGEFNRSAIVIYETGLGIGL